MTRYATQQGSGAQGASAVRTRAEIVSQPECWRRAATLLPGVTDLLPGHGERVAVLGCGTSWFVAQSYAVAREAAGHGETDAFAASEMQAGRRYDRVVALSRSGTTTEILQALADIGGAQPTVAITADPATPIAAAADAIIALDFADEQSVVQTRFATTELALLLAHLGTDLEPVAAAAERVLAEPLPELLAGARQYTFLGTGWTCGLASEAALKLRESASLWTEAYPAMEYRHGPIAVTGPGSLVWIFGPAPDGLAAEIATAGGAVWPGREHPLAELVRVHLVAVEIALAAGLDPDRPRNLTRSVILRPDEARPARVITVVTLNPALDITHEVERADWAGVNRPHTVHVRPGGKGVNVATTLRALGADVTLLGLAGGSTGQELAAALTGSGISVALTQVGGQTRRTFAVSDSGRGRTAVFNEPGPAIGEGEYAEFFVTYIKAVPGCAAVVLSGSLPPGLPEDTYASLIAAAGRAGVPVILDTSGAALRHGAAAGPALVKPNLAELVAALERADCEPAGCAQPMQRTIAQERTEAMALCIGCDTGTCDLGTRDTGTCDTGTCDLGTGAPGTGGPDPAAVTRAARALAGPAAVVVSLGQHGLVAVTADRAWHARPARTAEGNPTGAGDAVVAALAHGLVQGQDWPNRLRHAAALGAATVAAPVAGEFHEADYQRHLPEIQVTELPSTASGRTERAAGRTEPTTGRTEPTTGRTEPTTGRTEQASSQTEQAGGQTEQAGGQIERVAGRTEPTTERTERAGGRTERAAGRLRPTSRAGQSAGSRAQASPVRVGCRLMVAVSVGEIVAAARAAGHGVGAFNVIGIEHAEAIVTGAEAAGAPVVLQISQNCVAYHGALAPIGTATMAIARSAAGLAGVMLDHAESADLVSAAVEIGIGAVMFDASALDYTANMAVTAELARWGHARGVWVEAELGEIGGKDGVHAPGARTRPDDAAAFVAATGVDALAVAVGSSHAMLTRNAVLDFELIGRLSEQAGVPLVLHGSSGVPDDGLAAAIRAGMTKINIATQLNKVFTAALRDRLTADQRLVDPRKYCAAGRDAVAAEVARLLGVLGAAS